MLDFKSLYEVERKLSEERLKKITEERKLSDERLKKITELEKDLDQAKNLAGALQFILHIRARVEEFESSIGSTYIINDCEYETWITNNFGENAPEIRNGFHYRKWIRILHTANPNDSFQLLKILSRLNGHNVDELRINIHHFALSMHRLYKILSQNVHNYLILPVNFIDPNHISQYITLLPVELQNDVRLFYDTGN